MFASRFQSPRGLNFGSKLLLLSLLPTLLFVGHWSLHLEIPGTNSYVGTQPAKAETTSGHHHDGPSDDRSNHDHEQHCHANAATCADAAAVPVAPVAHLAEAIAALGADSAWREIRTEARSLTGWTGAPQVPPPRSNPSA